MCSNPYVGTLFSIFSLLFGFDSFWRLSAFNLLCCAPCRALNICLQMHFQNTQANKPHVYGLNAGSLCPSNHISEWCPLLRRFSFPAQREPTLEALWSISMLSMCWYQSLFERQRLVGLIRHKPHERCELFNWMPLSRRPRHFQEVSMQRCDGQM